MVTEVRVVRAWLRDDMRDYERYIEEPVYRLPMEVLRPWEGNPEIRGGADSRYRSLVHSLKEHGQLVPAFVLPPEEGIFTIWDGCRRFRGLHEPDINVPFMDCLIRPVTTDFLVKVFATNMTSLGWNAHGLAQVARRYEDRTQVADACPDSSVRSKLRRLITALTKEQYDEFVQVLGPRANEVAGRVQRYLRWDDSRRADILMWMARRTKGDTKSVRNLEQAIGLRIPARKIAAAIEGDRAVRLW